MSTRRIHSSLTLALTVIVFTCMALAASAENSRNISPAQWDKLTADKAFAYRNLKEVSKQPEVQQPGILQRLLSGFFGLFGSGFGKILLWIIVFSLLGYIAYRLLSANNLLFAKRPGATADEAGAEEEDIAAVDWERQMQQAISNKDLRMAVRYSYMWLLRMLQEEQLITYRIDKTNYDYYTELANTPYKQPFKKLSRQYEYVWYGQYTIEPGTFDGYLAQFNQVKQQLQR